MSSADLFSFLDDAPQDEDIEESYDDTEMQVEETVEEAMEHDDDTKKRKAQDTDAPEDSRQDPGPSAPKKQRLDSPKPAVVDEVEIEAKREVPAVAGLQVSSGEAGAKLELRHQVRVCIIVEELDTHNYHIIIGPPPSSSSFRLPIYTHLSTRPTRKTSTRIPLHSRSLPTGLRLRDSKK